MSAKTLVIVIVIVVVAAAAYYFIYQKGYQPFPKKEKEAEEISPWKTIENPLEKVPSTNPFEKVINPFKELYKNPFK